MTTPKPRFCSQCGGPMVDRVDGEGHPRLVCSECGRVAYLNPQVLVSTIVMSGNRLLLCRRSDPPAAGMWMLPGGFMECGETLEQAAAREILEETGVSLKPEDLLLYSVANLPGINEVYVGFVTAVPESTQLVAGSECDEVQFFDEIDIPWTEIAYPDVGSYLRVYFSERRRGQRSIHFGVINATDVVSKCFRIVEIEDAYRQRVASDVPS